MLYSVVVNYKINNVLPFKLNIYSLNNPDGDIMQIGQTICQVPWC